MPKRRESIPESPIRMNRTTVLLLLILAGAFFTGSEAQITSNFFPASEYTFGTYTPVLTPCFSNNVNRYAFSLFPIMQTFMFTPVSFINWYQFKKIMYCLHFVTGHRHTLHPSLVRQSGAVLRQRTDRGSWHCRGHRRSSFVRARRKVASQYTGVLCVIKGWICLAFLLIVFFLAWYREIPLTRRLTCHHSDPGTSLKSKINPSYRTQFQVWVYYDQGNPSTLAIKLAWENCFMPSDKCLYSTNFAFF